MPVGDLVWYLEFPARFMPVTYLIEAMGYVVIGRGTAGEYHLAVAALVTFSLLAVTAAGLVVRRRPG